VLPEIRGDLRLDLLTVVLGAVDEHHKVVGIAGQKARSPRSLPQVALPLLGSVDVPLVGHPLIEVVQVDVGQQWRDNPALWCTIIARKPLPVHHHPRSQELLHEPDDTFVFDRAAQDAQQGLMVDAVKAFPNIRFDRGGVSPPADQVAEAHRRVVGCPVGAKPIPMAVKPGFVDRLQDQPEHLLDNAVPNGRDTEWPLVTIRFRDVDPTHRLWLVGVRCKLLPEGLDQGLFGGIRREVLVGYPINARCPGALVGEYASKCQGRQALGAYEIEQAMKDVSVKTPLCQHGLRSINPEV